MLGELVSSVVLYLPEGRLLALNVFVVDRQCEKKPGGPLIRKLLIPLSLLFLPAVLAGRREVRKAFCQLI